MSSIRAFLLLLSLFAVAFGGCGDCGGGKNNPDGGDDAGLDAGDDGGDSGDSGEPDPGEEEDRDWEEYVPPEPVETDPNDPENENIDSDCDGLSDHYEYTVVYADGLKTNPGLADSDGDRIPDGVELGRTESVDPNCAGTFVPDADPDSTTSPVHIDTDGDGVIDGREDRNRDGKVDPNEMDPNLPDTDGDGLKDGEEDVNGNGRQDGEETDPLNKDSDGDGANDGVEVNFMRTNPLNPDTDGDGCMDTAEDINQDGVVDAHETNPLDGTDCGSQNIVDSDQDGIPDEIELATGTDPNNPDSDGDGIPDGIEDTNKNGVVNAGETDPRRVDSDCDGIPDGDEDANKNGVVNAGETDPRKFDTDDDGLSDGQELGLTAPQYSPADPACAGIFKPDTDPTSTTDPTKPDTDGDGIMDGAEDQDQNGRVDDGELDPNNATDGQGPAGAVCTTANLRQVRFEGESAPDISLGLPTTFNEVNDIIIGGETRGMMGYDSTRKVAFLVYRRAAPGANPTADEVAIRNQIDNHGALSNITSQPFSSWDGYDALEGLYDQAGSGDIKSHANALANTLVGGTAGVLSGSAGTGGPFKVQAQYIHRSNNSLVVIVAITAQSLYNGEALFSMKDVAGGSAVAQFGDTTGVQCEPFTPSTAKVDFIFTVDDSGSMSDKQTALSQASAEMVTRLNNSSLDYRLGLVTTYYHRTSGTNIGRFEGFVGPNDINRFRCWLEQGRSNCGGDTWIGASGNGTEGMLGAMRKAIDDMSNPATGKPQRRPDATVIGIMLGDADDQTSNYTDTHNTNKEPIANFLRYFTASGNPLDTTPPPPHDNPTGAPIVAHGIICPDDQTCGESDSFSNPRRNQQIITATGGVRGSIMAPSEIANSINLIVDDAIGRTGYKLKKPPIGASIKVAMTNVLNPAGCSTAATDMPRSRQNGWDFEGKTGTLAFFGDCRPTQTSQAAVSYRYWINNTLLPDGSPPPCAQDPYFDGNDPDFCQGNLTCDLNYNQCVCPTNCGGNPPTPGMVCNSNIEVCDFICTPDCGGACGANESCNTGTCGCFCEQTSSCPAGQTFVDDGETCGCVCDAAALNCGPTHAPDLDACACVCQDNCGGACPAGTVCNMNTCGCDVRID